MSTTKISVDGTESSTPRPRDEKFLLMPYVKFVVMPFISIVTNSFQFIMLPWKMELPGWPIGALEFFRIFTRILYFEWFPVSIPFLINAVYIAMGLSLFSAIFVSIPLQKLVNGLGQRLTSLLQMFNDMIQALVLLPLCARLVYGFAPNQMVETDVTAAGYERYKDGLTWFEGEHIGIFCASVVGICALTYASVKHVSQYFDPLEAAKRIHYQHPWDQHKPLYLQAYTLLNLLVAAVLILVPKNQSYTGYLAGALLLLACICIVAVLTWVHPFVNQTAHCFVFAMFSTAIFSTLIGLIAVLGDTDDGYYMVSIWVFGCSICPFVFWNLGQYFLVKTFERLIVSQRASGNFDCGKFMRGPVPKCWVRYLEELTDGDWMESVGLEGAGLSIPLIQQVAVSVASNTMAKITTLNLKNNNFNQGQGHGLGVLLKVDTSLEELILDDNRLPTGIPVLSSGLEHNKSLLKVSMVNCGLEASAGASLGNMLLSNSVLRSLDLAKNYLGAEGCKALAEGLKQNTVLQKLDISWNEAGFDGLQAVIDALPRSIDLNLTCNRVPKVSFDALKAKLPGPDSPAPPGPTLEELFAALEVDSIYALVGKVLNMDPTAAIDAVCDKFYLFLVTDRCTVPFFSCITMGRMRHLQTQCLVEALGGPKVYKGLDLKTAHAHLRITDEHYDAVIAHLFRAILFYIPEPPGAVVKALVDLTEALRPLCVNTTLEEQHCRNPTVSELHEATELATNRGKAKSFFFSSIFKTGFMKSRKDGDTHPALDIKN